MTALFMVVTLCFVGCGDANLKVKYDLTNLDGVTTAVGTELSTGKYQSKYRDSVFKMRGVLCGSEDYYYLVVNDYTCCNFDMDIRPASDDVEIPTSKLNKSVTVIGTYTRDGGSGSESAFYLSVAKFL